MNGNDFIDLAGQLVSQATTAPTAASTEAKCRTAVSPAYYGAFHHAVDLLQRMTVRTTHRHGEVFRLLQISGVKDCVDAGDALSRLHSRRVAADYELRSPDFASPASVMPVVEKAGEIRDILVTCGQEPAFTAIKAGIEAYQKKFPAT